MPSASSSGPSGTTASVIQQPLQPSSVCRESTQRKARVSSLPVTIVTRCRACVAVMAMAMAPNRALR